MQKIICAFIFLLFSTSVLAEEPTFSNENGINIQNNLKLVTQIKKLENEKARYLIQAAYPQLTGKKLDKSAQEFNQQISNFTFRRMEEFKTKVAATETASLPENEKNSALNIHFEATVLQPNNQPMISVRFNVESYFAGQTHPNHLIKTFNYDFNAEKMLALKDVFKSGAGYLQLLANYSRTELENKKVNPDHKWLSEGLVPTAENYRNWNLKSDGLLVTFDEYQVAAYMHGQPEVLIPYSALQGMVSSQTPVAVCVQDPASCG